MIWKNIPFISMVYINECIGVNTALKKFLQIYELFAYYPTVSKEFPTLASPRFFQIYGLVIRKGEMATKKVLAPIS